jgi:hypothetical protein
MYENETQNKHDTFFSPNIKIGKLMVSFPTSHFLSLIHTSLTPTPMLLQLDTQQNKQPAKLYPKKIALS